MIFFESNIHSTTKRGSIEVICGSMFSGKTEELIRRLKRSQIAKLKVEIFKPKVDSRYSENEVVSHDRNAILSTPVDSSGNIMLLADDVNVVGIDEAQFFDDGLVDVCTNLANRGIRVIIAGLDMDYKGIPFGPVPALCAIADDVTKVHAVCMRCGSPAYVSHRLVDNDKRVLLGEKGEYEPICRNCFTEAIKNGELK
jgi:thymidine kinase